MGKKQPVSFTNEAYEPTTGTFQAPPETAKEKNTDYSNAEVIENHYTIQTNSNTNKEKTSSDSYDMNGGIEMGSTSYTIQTTPAEAAVQEPSDPYTVLTTTSFTNHYQSLSATVSSDNENDRAF